MNEKRVYKLLGRMNITLVEMLREKRISHEDYKTMYRHVEDISDTVERLFAVTAVVEEKMTADYITFHVSKNAEKETLEAIVRAAEVAQEMYKKGEFELLAKEE